MVCYYPLHGWRTSEFTKELKKGITFDRKIAHLDLPLTIPCGQCIGCRLERSRQWAVRCFHESKLYEHNCFITLTYNDQFLPSDNSLHVRPFQLFMKRLRKTWPDRTIRFYQCGEYGETCHNCEKSQYYCRCGNFYPALGRPHYHACLFNFDFIDKKLFKQKNGVSLYTSSDLQNLWSDPKTKEPYGFCTTGDVSFDSAAYVARYLVKKINGDLAADHYNGRKPEYTTMSRRPGIGAPWLLKYATDVFPGDFVLINNKKVLPPPFYDQLFSEINSKSHRQIKGKRAQKTKLNKENNNDTRLRVRETIQKTKVQNFTRNLD